MSGFGEDSIDSPEERTMSPGRGSLLYSKQAKPGSGLFPLQLQSKSRSTVCLPKGTLGREQQDPLVLSLGTSTGALLAYLARSFI